MNPLFFLIPSVYTDKIYCYGDNYQFDKNYNYFYGSNQFEPKSTQTGGSVIFDIMFGKDKIETAKNITQCSGTDPVQRFDLSINKISISLVTLVNLTAGIRVNNPPNPPYINVNKLKQIMNILKYFSDIKKNRSEFFTTNFDKIFVPVLKKIRDYLIGKYENVNDVVDLDIAPDNISADVTDLYNILAADTRYSGMFSNNLDLKGKKKLTKDTYKANTTKIPKDNWKLFSSSTPKGEQNDYSLDELIESNLNYFKFVSDEIALGPSGYLSVKKDQKDQKDQKTLYKINDKIVYRQTEFNKANISHFRKIASDYVFYKNTFAANDLLKTLYVDKLIAPGEWGFLRSTEHERILKVFENCMQIKNEDLNLSDPVYKSIFSKDIRGDPIDDNKQPINLTKLHIIDLYYYLAKYTYDLIDSSNPATLIGTVDFQEYTQFRDTEKLYMTCDGNNNSYQIMPKANEDFLTQPLPQQLKGGSNDLFDWIDINI